MKTRLSTSYKRLTATILLYASEFSNNKKFTEMTKDDNLVFLNSLRKSEDKDPLHGWVSTYNTYLIVLGRFFKWLYHPDLSPKERLKVKPSCIELSGLKRKEQSFLKQCNADVGNLPDFCDSVKEALKKMILNETSSSNATSHTKINTSEAYESYTDSFAGFSLEYPSNWKVDDSSSPTSSTFYKGGREFEAKLWEDVIFSLADAKDKGEAAMHAATDDGEGKLLKSLQSYGKGIDGEEAVTFTYSDSGVIKKVVSVIHDEKAYDFIYSSTTGTLDEDDEIMNHFFHSIKFE